MSATCLTRDLSASERDWQTAPRASASGLSPVLRRRRRVIERGRWGGRGGRAGDDGVGQRHVGRTGDRDASVEMLAHRDAQPGAGAAAGLPLDLQDAGRRRARCCRARSRARLADTGWCRDRRRRPARRRWPDPAAADGTSHCAGGCRRRGGTDSPRPPSGCRRPATHSPAVLAASDSSAHCARAPAASTPECARCPAGATRGRLA